MDGNATSPTQSSDNEFMLESYPQQIIIAIILCLVTVIGIVGNLHVVLAVLLCRKLRSSTNWLVVNLGMADLITCLFLPFNVVAVLSQDGWPIAEWTCVTTGAVTVTCLGTSVINLALIALNRYVLLTKSRHTFYRVYSKRNIIIMVVLSWIYPFLLVIIPSLAGLGKLGYSEKYKTCQQDTSLPNSDYYSLIAAVFVIIPAFVFIVIMYVLIYRAIVRHNRDIVNNLAREDVTSSFERTNVDMSTSWTDYQDRQNGADDSGKASSSSTDGVSIRPTHPQSFESSHKPTGCHNLSEADHQSRNSSSDSVAEICDSENCEVIRSDPKNSGQLNISSPRSENTTNASNMSNVADVSKSAPKISRHHISVTKRLSLVVASFFICFLPIGICVMVPTSDPAVPWANLLIVINSCINPILYAGKMPLFREVMWCIARCRFQKIPERVKFDICRR